MSIGLVFWIVWLIALIFSLYTNRSSFPAWAGGGAVYFILIFLLGVGVFGWPIKG